MAPVPKPKPHLYTALVELVTLRRLRYYDRGTLVVAAVGLLLHTRFLAYGLFVSLPLHAWMLWVGLHCVRQARERCVEVGALPHTLVAGELLDKNVWKTVGVLAAGHLVFGGYFAWLLVSGTGVGMAIEAKTLSRPSINDAWVYAVWWVVVVAAAYAGSLVAHRRQRLNITYHQARAEPTLGIYTPSFVESAVLTAYTGALPVVYQLVRSPLYTTLSPFLALTGFLTTAPPRALHFGLTVRLVLTLFGTLLLWNLANTAFTAYYSLGCLDRGKPLAAYSSDPVHLLLTGLVAPAPVVRAMAFLELEYRATASDAALRKPLYATQTWPQVFGAVVNAVAPVTALLEPKKTVPVADASGRFSVFGNSKLGLQQEPATPPLTKKLQAAHAEGKLLPALLKDAQRLVSQLQALPVGAAFRHTPERTVLAKIGDKASFGNAVVAGAYLVIHARDEDSVGDAAGLLTETMVLLQRVVGVCEQELAVEELAELHDLAMECFFRVAVAYNAYLLDLLLPPEVYRLAKQVIDAAIEENK